MMMNKTITAVLAILFTSAFLSVSTPAFSESAKPDSKCVTSIDVLTDEELKELYSNG